MHAYYNSHVIKMQWREKQKLTCWSVVTGVLGKLSFCFWFPPLCFSSHLCVFFLFSLSLSLILSLILSRFLLRFPLLFIWARIYIYNIKVLYHMENKVPNKLILFLKFNLIKK